MRMPVCSPTCCTCYVRTRRKCYATWNYGGYYAGFEGKPIFDHRGKSRHIYSTSIIISYYYSTMMDQRVQRPSAK